MPRATITTFVGTNLIPEWKLGRIDEKGSPSALCLPQTSQIERTNWQMKEKMIRLTNARLANVRLTDIEPVLIIEMKNEVMKKYKKQNK